MSPGQSTIERDEPLLPTPPAEPMPSAVAARVRAAFMYVPAWTESLMWCPWVLEATTDGIMTRPVHLDTRLVALVRLVVAQDNSCRYCYGTARSFLRILGYSDELIRSLEHDLLAADLDPKRRAALDYARLVSRANPRPGADHRAGLRALGYSDVAIAELGAFAGLWVMENRIATLTAIPPHPIEGYIDRWWVKLARPLLGRMVDRKFRGAPLAVVDPAARVAVFDDLVGVLGDLPVATNLRKIVDAAFRDGPLPRRTRVVVCAVIGRALGCDRAGRQLASLLGPDEPGWADIDAMLTRLDADWLDERERLLIPVAREAARSPQPRMIQRRLLELRDHLSPAEFVDFIGLAAVACALGRLGVLLEAC